MGRLKLYNDNILYMMFKRCKYCKNRLYCFYYQQERLILHYHCIDSFFNANKFNPNINQEEFNKLQNYLK